MFFYANNNTPNSTYINVPNMDRIKVELLLIVQLINFRKISSLRNNCEHQTCRILIASRSKTDQGSILNTCIQYIFHQEMHNDLVFSSCHMQAGLAKCFVQSLVRD